MKQLVLAISLFLFSCTKASMDSVDTSKTDGLHFGQLKQQSDTTRIQIRFTNPNIPKTVNYDMGIQNVGSVWLQVLGPDPIKYAAMGWNQTKSPNQAIVRDCKVYYIVLDSPGQFPTTFIPTGTDRIYIGLCKPYGTTLKAGDVFTFRDYNFTTQDYDLMFSINGSTFGYANNPLTFKVISYKDNNLYATFSGGWVDTASIISLPIVER
jgi:hypothetical protein